MPIQVTMEMNTMPRIRYRRGIHGYRPENEMDKEIKISTWKVGALGKEEATQDLKRKTDLVCLN